jgi:hypothetical protein
VALLRRRNAAFWASVALAVAAAAGPFLLIVSDFFTLFDVRSITATISGGAVSGARNHAYAMLIIGLLAAPMAYGAVRGASRPAAVALAVLGLVAALIALGIDLPDATGTSTLDKSYAYASAEAAPAIGLYLETLGAALLLIAGSGGLLMVTNGRPEAAAASPPTADRDEVQRTEAAAARAAARSQRASDAPPRAHPLTTREPAPAPGSVPPPSTSSASQPAEPQADRPREGRGGFAGFVSGQLGRRRGTGR